MKEWLVDTCVLLDVIGADAAFGESSRRTLADCADSGVLIVNQIVFAEVGALVESLEDLNDLLPEMLFRRESIPWEAAWLAGRAFQTYKQKGGSKKRMLADFIIGAHAAVAGYGLISRDRGYAGYFKLDILDPSSSEQPG